tara:strand:+ start:694 stop:1095 length:402 start_codon:yes stop_codon:yes gene_type:complete
MERITFKTITDTGGTEPKDNAAGALNQGFASGMQAAQNAEENKKEDTQNNQDDNNNQTNDNNNNGYDDTELVMGPDGFMVEASELENDEGGDADIELQAAGSWKDGKTFGETKVGKGLGNIGKFVKFWATKGM